jgi:2,4-dienoyl-CoA reductase-like NADH-dependent reductase (Old Yellow Enzyme family)
MPEGFVSSVFTASYVQRTRHGIGLAVIESTYVLPPRDRLTSHIGLYADAQVSAFHQCIEAIRAAGPAVIVMLDQPLWTGQATAAELERIGEAFVVAAWRARAAGADGIMLSTADGGVFEQLISPLRNHRSDRYGGDSIRRLQLLSDVLEAVGSWLGPSFVTSVRLNVEEFASGGLTLQDSRTIATRLVSMGVRLIEVRAERSGEATVARFPGWRVPLAEALKSVVDIPLLVGGQLDDPLLADSVIRDSSADLIAIGERLHSEPSWPERAWAALHGSAG